MADGPVPDGGHTALGGRRPGTGRRARPRRPPDAGPAFAAAASRSAGRPGRGRQLGRRELRPGSDLDLVLLHNGRDDVARIADRIWYPIWDSGVGLDHSVRTVDEAAKVARRGPQGRAGPDPGPARGGRPRADAARRARPCSPSGGPTPGAGWPSCATPPTSAPSAAASWPSCSNPTSRTRRGGLRDVQAMQAVAAAWVASAPGPRVREAYELMLDITARACTR